MIIYDFESKGWVELVSLKPAWKRVESHFDTVNRTERLSSKPPLRFLQNRSNRRGLELHRQRQRCLSQRFKISTSLQRLSRMKQWQDLFRVLHPHQKSFSHVYRRNMKDQGLTEGAARLDRLYGWGDLTVSKAEYFPAAFSDHVTFPYRKLIISSTS